MDSGLSRNDKLGLGAFALLAVLLGILLVSMLSNGSSTTTPSAAALSEEVSTPVPTTAPVQAPTPTPTPTPFPTPAPTATPEPEPTTTSETESSGPAADETGSSNSPAPAAATESASAAESAPQAAADTPNPQPAATEVPNPQPAATEVPNPQLPEATTVPNPQPGSTQAVSAPPPNAQGGSFTYTLTATVGQPTLYNAPGGAPFMPTFGGTSLPAVAPWGGDLVYPVIAGTPENNNGWAQVRVPSGGNSTTAWVQTNQFRWGSSNRMIQISVSTKSVTIFEGSTVVYSTAAVLGKPGSSTPVAQGFVEAFVAPPSGAYGPGVIPLGIFSTDLGSFGGALPKVALHGTNKPGLMGTYSSNGCIRVENSAFNAIRSMVTLGSKVQIVP